METVSHYTLPIRDTIIGGSCHQYYFCRDKGFVATNIYKHVFVATKYVFCRDKSMLGATKLLSRENYVCRRETRVAFVTTSILLLRQKTCFVATKLCLSRQIHVCFIATKMILVAAPANDSIRQPLRL